MNWYLAVLKKYADFSGRARRTEYWMFFLVNLLISIAATLLDRVLDTTFGSADQYGAFSLFYSLAVFIPGLAVAVRRLHDIGKSGWYILVLIIPLVGIIWLLILLVREGDRGANAYGEDPKGFNNIQTDFA
jgi:uncharacterized membrane protein YhaH (DUF805 family)